MPSAKFLTAGNPNLLLPPPAGAAAVLKKEPFTTAFKGARRSFHVLHPNFLPRTGGDGRRRGAQRRSFVSAP